VAAAGWRKGLEEVLGWIRAHLRCGDTLMMVDASLVVDNATGARECEREVGRRYGRWKVSANPTNLGSAANGGVVLLGRLQAEGWTYDDGLDGPPATGQRVSECYPYATLVGADELGYDRERPPYKRQPRGSVYPAKGFRRALVFDELVGRVDRLRWADPPLRLDSHPLTCRLLRGPAPVTDVDYKRGEDLLDAVLCAWTGALWLRHGAARCSVLGASTPASRPAPTIVAPHRAGTAGPLTG
ncbi:MAG TPA: DUF429 domain-containing protein, partial [Acidimicrobiales bacterium]|nr:DUF429 domain-containing protein [Acidimicrobiales bacterium]